MLIEVSAKEFKHRFDLDPNPFISEKFIELNKEKADKIVRLVENKQKVSIGLVAGIKDNMLKVPFSAPFGGFHYRNESIYINTIEEFIEHLLVYAKKQGIKEISLTLPPSLYQQSFNAKLVNILIRMGFEMALPDITNWIELKYFNGKFSHRNSREYYQQAIRNNLTFSLLDDNKEKRLAFELIYQNRVRFGRPIYMNLNDIIRIGELWQVDFFGVNNSDGKMLAAGIFYQFPKKIAFAVFWGDNETGRPLRAMDFLTFNLLSYYKSSGFEYIDLGKSTESGIPNEGLLRFKETHESVSSLRFSFTWNA